MSGNEASSAGDQLPMTGGGKPKFASEAVLHQVFDDTSARAPKREGESEDYRISLPVFEGPLDLLLHLIRREQINIYDIPVSQICKNYLEYLDIMFAPDCDVAGEFFVMAATLVHLKSLVLLPRDEQSPEDDPRLPLVAQLLEYERFKKAALDIDALPWLDRDIYARPLSAQSELPVESLLDGPIESVDPYQLLVNLKSATDRTERPPLQISVDTTSLREKVVLVGQMLDDAVSVEFRTMLPPNYKRIDIVMSFMAILELARLKYIEVLQTENFGPIHVRRVQSVKDLNMDLLDQF